MNIYTETHYYKTARIINFQLNKLAINRSDLPVSSIISRHVQIRFFINNFQKIMNYLIRKNLKKNVIKILNYQIKPLNHFQKLDFHSFLFHVYQKQ